MIELEAALAEASLQLREQTAAVDDARVRCAAWDCSCADATERVRQAADGAHDGAMHGAALAHVVVSH